MLLKALIATLAFFLGSVGLLRLSVLAENYTLLAAGLLLAVAAVFTGLKAPERGHAAA